MATQADQQDLGGVSKEIFRPMIPFNECYSEEKGNLRVLQKRYKSRRDIVVAANEKPRVAIMAITGPPGFPMVADRHLFLLSWIRVWQLLPMRRSLARRTPQIPEGLADHPEFQTLEHRYHLQQMRCRTEDQDIIFGGAAGLIGKARDAGQCPRTEYPEWIYCQPVPQESWLIAPISGELAIGEDDLFINVRINGLTAFRFWKDAAYIACPELQNVNGARAKVKAGDRIAKVVEPVPYLEAKFHDERHIRGKMDPDIIPFGDSHTLNVVMAMFKVWDAEGSKPTLAPYLTFMRRMVQIPDKKLLDDWKPPAAFTTDREVVAECLERGIDPKKEPEVYKHLFEHNYVVGPGERGYPGKHWLVDWRFVNEKVRAASGGNDWASFNHMKRSVEASAGNGYVVVVGHTGEKGLEAQDARYEFQNGIYYDYTPVTNRPAEPHSRALDKKSGQRPRSSNKPTFRKPLRRPIKAKA